MRVSGQLTCTVSCTGSDSILHREPTFVLKTWSINFFLTEVSDLMGASSAERGLPVSSAKVRNNPETYKHFGKKFQIYYCSFLRQQIHQGFEAFKNHLLSITEYKVCLIEILFVSLQRNWNKKTQIWKQSMTSNRYHQDGSSVLTITVR